MELQRFATLFYHFFLIKVGVVFYNELGPTRTAMWRWEKTELKRTCSSGGSSETGIKKSKHKIEYGACWKEFPWLVPVYAEEGNLVSCCVLCQRHGTKQCNCTGTWTDKPCTYLRKDMLQRHKTSQMHKNAEVFEAQRLASWRDGGIAQAFSSRVLINRKALIGAIKMMYWLAKEEIAHTTKFSSLMDLSIQLGSDYLRELNLGRNAHYTNEQTIRELLHCLSSSVEEKIFEDVSSSEFFGLMTNESTDIAMLKQLVLLVRYITEEGVKTFTHSRYPQWNS